jgi:hypothetical protein
MRINFILNFYFFENNNNNNRYKKRFEQNGNTFVVMDYMENGRIVSNFLFLCLYFFFIGSLQDYIDHSKKFSAQISEEV